MPLTLKEEFQIGFTRNQSLKYSSWRRWIYFMFASNDCISWGFSCAQPWAKYYRSYYFVESSELVLRACLLSHVQLFATPWTVARQVPLSVEFSRQEYWSGFYFLLQGIFPDPGIKSMSPALRAEFFTLWATRVVSEGPKKSQLSVDSLEWQAASRFQTPDDELSKTCLNSCPLRVYFSAALP